MPSTDDIRNALQQMPSISLDEMNAIRLMNRIDTKFVTSAGMLLRVLQDASRRGYRVCEINGKRLMDYLSLYFDTPDLRMYLAHHNGKKPRQKIRTRSYLVSGITFLEIKHKNNKERTRKKRMAIPTEAFGQPEQLPDAQDFISRYSMFPTASLTPSCTTEFQRMTLVNAGCTERLTIDVDLHFTNRRNQLHAALPEAVVIELKQDGRCASEMKAILLEHRIKPFRISKYCMGISLTESNIRRGRFKEKIRQIEKITQRKSIIQ